MIKKYKLLFYTLKYLKPIQIYYRGYYFIRKKLKNKYPLFSEANSQKINFENRIKSYCSYKDKTFTFLNLSKKFDDIDWNFKEYGKLWTYNLNYFDYLNQREIKKEDGLQLIYDFIKKIENIKDGLEPYPISLRGINWIKFLSKYSIEDKKIDDSLLAQYYILLDSLEYHLLGNHLLENGFSLLWGGVYFNDNKLLSKAKKILYSELQEQILEDGGHFELSPMYHQIIFYRLLDAIQLVEKNLDDKKLLEFLKDKASKMQSWLENITFENGEIPLLNDAAHKIAPTSKGLFDYFNYLNIKKQKLNLSDSGYRKIKKQNYECIVDIGQIGPDYIPGHAHADTFNFVLNIKNKPFIIDTGISTYEVGKIRDYERSTKAHNTVEVNNKNSSEIWGGFRVANRAYVIDLEESESCIKAIHNGYQKRFGVLHKREWCFFNERILIKDTLSRESNAVFRLHFHPQVNLGEIKRRVRAMNSVFDININDCFVAFEFNKRVRSKVLEINFKKEIGVEILT